MELEAERGAVDLLREKLRLTKQIFDEQRRRSTNEDYFNWYVGRISKLYSSAFDITVRFCKLAEASVQDRLPGSTFIRPQFDKRYRGLLSGQSLMLDLQRMELAELESGGTTGARSTMTNEGDFSLNDAQLSALRSSGQAMFQVQEKDVDKVSPGETDRRIKSVQVRLGGVESTDARFTGKLTMVNHSPRSNGKQKTRTVHRRESIVLKRVVRLVYFSSTAWKVKYFGRFL